MLTAADPSDPAAPAGSAAPARQPLMYGLVSGAVIVAAVDRKAFDILYYAPATALRSSNEEISRFPEGLVPEIRRRAAPAD